MIDDELKKEAIRLREQGYTYSQIVDKLSGSLSLDWCKRNLKGVKKLTKASDPCVDELIKQAIRPQGCTSYEAAGIVYKHHTKEEATQDKIKGLKRKAMAANTEALFRPAWIDYKDPINSNLTMLSCAHNIYERIQEEVNDYMRSFPTVNRFAVMNEIVKLACEHVMPEPLLRRLDRNSNICELLYDRCYELEQEEEEQLNTLLEPARQKSVYEDEGIEDDLKERQWYDITEEELDEIWKYTPKS